jgi:hypothetical protein
MRFFSIVAIAFFLFSAAGCGSKVSVSGKVTFDDGSPLTSGEVRFETAEFVSSGAIQPDGTYRLGTTSAQDGIPKGTYGVTVRAMSTPELKPGVRTENVPPPKSLINTKFGATATSELTCEVKGSTTFNITVQKP